MTWGNVEVPTVLVASGFGIEGSIISSDKAPVRDVDINLYKNKADKQAGRLLLIYCSHIQLITPFPVQMASLCLKIFHVVNILLYLLIRVNTQLIKYNQNHFQFL